MKLLYFRDNDKQSDQEKEKTCVDSGGAIFTWRAGNYLEKELFLSLTGEAVGKLIDYAIELHSKERIANHICSRAENGEPLDDIQCDASLFGYSTDVRNVLAQASSIRTNGWFKQLSWMEYAAREIIGPDIAKADEDFRETVEHIFGWVGNAGA